MTLAAGFARNAMFCESRCRPLLLTDHCDCRWTIIAAFQIRTTVPKAIGVESGTVALAGG